MAMVKLDDDTRNRLRVYKAEHGDTYTEAIERLLDTADHRLADAEPHTQPEDNE